VSFIDKEGQSCWRVFIDMDVDNPSKIKTSVELIEVGVKTIRMKKNAAEGSEKTVFLVDKILESHLSKFGLATKSQASGIQASAVSINMTWKSGKHSPLVSERLKALRFVQQQKS
jgi:hypothetical protein